jgi:hypothetical protein
VRLELEVKVHDVHSEKDNGGPVGKE